MQPEAMSQYLTETRDMLDSMPNSWNPNGLHEFLNRLLVTSISQERELNRIHRIQQDLQQSVRFLGEALSKVTMEEIKQEIHYQLDRHLSQPTTESLTTDSLLGVPVREVTAAEIPQSQPSVGRNEMLNGLVEFSSECVQSPDKQHLRLYFQAIVPQSTSSSIIGMGWWCRMCGVFSFNGSTLAPAVAIRFQKESTSPSQDLSPSAEVSEPAKSPSSLLPLNKNPISHERAREAAHRLIRSHFDGAGKPGSARATIPVQADDDDIIITEYIDQQEQQVKPDLEIPFSMGD